MTSTYRARGLQYLGVTVGIAVGVALVVFLRKSQDPCAPSAMSTAFLNRLGGVLFILLGTGHLVRLAAFPERFRLRGPERLRSAILSSVLIAIGVSQATEQLLGIWFLVATAVVGLSALVARPARFFRSNVAEASDKPAAS